MIAIVFSVLLYRLAVAGLIYRVVSGFTGGPSIGDIIVSITGACIQLVAIIIMNRVYEWLAYKLTNWGQCYIIEVYTQCTYIKIYIYRMAANIWGHNFHSDIFRNFCETIFMDHKDSKYPSLLLDSFS